MKRYLIFVLAMILVCGMSYAEEKTIGIGIVYDNDSSVNEKMKNIFMDEIQKLMGKERVKLVREAKDGNSVEGIKKAIKTLNDDETVDVIITLGVIGSHIADKEDNYKKKVIAPFMYSKNTTDSSIALNVTVIAADYGLEQDIEYFMNITGVKKLNIVVEKEFGNDYFKEMEGLEKYLDEKKIDYKIVELQNPIEKTFENMNTSEGVFFGLVKEFSDKEMEITNRILTEKKIPSYSIMGRLEVTRGMSMGVDYSKDIGKFARKTAIILSKIADGDEVKKRENVIVEHKKYLINADFAGTGVYDKSNVEVMGEISKNKKTLRELIEAAYKNNLKIEIRNKEKEIQKEEEKGAMAKLMPKLKAGISGVWLDKNTILDNKGMAREKTVTGELTLTQVIFSEQANMNKDVQKKVSEVKDAEIERQKQDLNAEIMITYLNYMKAESNLKIQKNLLNTNMENLSMAKNKQQIGAINPADVYRWESEAAISRISVRKAEDMVRMLKDRIVRLTGIDIKDEIYFEDSENIYGYIGNYNEEIKMKIEEYNTPFLEQMYSEKAIKNSMELKMIDKNKEIKKRILVSSERSRYVPTVALQSGYKKKLYKGGEGDNLMMKPESNDSWNVGVGVSIDLFSGGEKNAEIRKNRIEKEKVDEEKSDAEKDIKEAVKNEVDNLLTGYNSTKNMQEALAALEKNHLLVNDAYVNGMVDMSVLLSSRNALVYVEQGEAVAKYDYMISLVKLERLAGELEVR